MTKDKGHNNSYNMPMRFVSDPLVTQKNAKVI